MLKNGEILEGRYQVIGEIGKGGTGIIYLGYHLTLCKYVVIKKIKEHFVGNINARAEVDILKKIHHRYLPQVYDFLVIGTGVYTIMDYIDGHDMMWFTENGYIFTEDQLILMLRQLCEVLEYLHGQTPPIIHSDIKPGNIMIRENGEICLIDFNISFGGEQEIVGYSPHFAAPEQIALAEAIRYGKKKDRLKVDEKSDIYSLGASFYYLMTGVLPQSGKERQSAPLHKMNTCYSAGLIRIVQKAMDVRILRYASAGRMKYDLERIHTKQKRIAVFLLAALTVFLGAGAIAAGIYSATGKSRDRFASAFYEFNEQRRYGEPEDVRKKGMVILNDSNMERQLKNHPEQKVEILTGIAETYYEEENYSAAAVFYEEALNGKMDNARRVLCVRDYIIALIRSRQTEKAQETLNTSGSIFSEETLTYLQAEFLLEENRKEEAYALFKDMSEESRDTDIRMRSCILAADCLKGTGKDKERLSLLSQAQQMTADRNIYRRIGEAYVEIAQSSGEKETSQRALEKAEECYAALSRESSLYLDRLNYAVILEMKRDYRGAQEILDLLEEEFPQDYRTYREKAWLCYWMEIQKEAQKRDFQGVLYYGRLAEQHYTASGQEDKKMAELMELIRELS